METSIFEGAAYGVDINGRIEGLAIIQPVGNLAWLMGARVRRDVRGKGVGKFLTKNLLEEARRRGFRGAALITSRNNTPVHRISESLGMKRLLSIKISSLRPLPVFIGCREIKKLSHDLREYNEILSRYLLLPATPDGFVWGYADYVLRNSIDEVYVYRSCISDLHMLIRVGCSYDLHNKCRTSIGAVVDKKRDSGTLEMLLCISELIYEEGFSRAIVIYEDSDSDDPLNNLFEWSWRAYLYYIDL